MRFDRPVVVSLLASAALAAQAPQDRPTFREQTNYIEVDAFVTDVESESVGHG